MLKSIPVSKLRIGMFISDTTSLSLATGSQLGILNDHELLESFKADTSGTVVIDTDLGLDVLESGMYNLKNRIEITHISKKNRRPIPPPALPEFTPTSLEEEILHARPLRKQALELINHSFQNVKMGRSVNTTEVSNLVKNLTETVLRNHNAILLLGQIRSKSAYLFEHSLNTCTLALTFCKWKNIDYDTTISIGVASLLHDIGELKLDDNITLNKGHLDDLDYQEMQHHVSFSDEILASTKGISPLTRHVVSQHHERLDGSGYPAKLSGKQIHPMSQLLGLVDTYDSMTAETTYRYAISPTQVLRQLLESDNQMFDNNLIKQFIKCIGIYPVGSLVRMNNGCIAIVNEVNSSDTLHPSVRLIYNARNEHFIKPVDVNLANDDTSDSPLSITGSVDPNYLHIDLAAFI